MCSINVELCSFLTQRNQIACICVCLCAHTMLLVSFDSCNLWLQSKCNAQMFITIRKSLLILFASNCIAHFTFIYSVSFVVFVYLTKYSTRSRFIPMKSDWVNIQRHQNTLPCRRMCVHIHTTKQWAMKKTREEQKKSTTTHRKYWKRRSKCNQTRAPVSFMLFVTQSHKHIHNTSTFARASTT